MNKSLILVVEDDTSVRNLITTTLKTHEYRYLTAPDGQSAILETSSHNPDIVLLDLGLPDIDGVEIIKKIRTWSNMPIIVISARSEDTDKIDALDAGADDYLTKPFSPREVLARMKAIFRRMRPAEKQKSSEIENTDDELTGETLQIGTIKADLDNYEVTVNDEKIFLTPKEFELLVYFMKRKDRVIDRDTLLDRIWNFDFAGQSRIVDVHVSHLREKIEKDPKNPRYLLTVRGFGYKFQEPKL